MERLGGSGFENALMKKRRSSTLRRPRPGNKLVLEQEDISSSPAVSSRSNSTKLSSGENLTSDGGSRKREFYLNNPPTANAAKHSTEGILSPANRRSSHKIKGSSHLHSGPADSHVRKSDGTHGTPVSPEDLDLSAKNKPMKVKLKVVGVPTTIQAKPKSEMGDVSLPLANPPRQADASRPRHLHKHSQGEVSKDSSKLTSSHDIKKPTKRKHNEDTLAQEKTDKVHQAQPSSEPIRKSRRVPKRRFLEDEFDEDDACYLEKLGTSKDVEDYTLVPANTRESSAKKEVLKTARSRTMPYEADEDFVLSRSNRDDRTKLRESGDSNNIEEDEPTSDSELETKNAKQTACDESPVGIRTQPLTTRRRALQSGKHGDGENAIEFPNGLPPAPSRRQKEKLSEEEILARKAEAAQRRRMQVQKAARESEAEAIRKILGLDSDKKKEEKKQKEREQKEKIARSQRFTGSAIKWIMGPNGTVVSFPNEIGLPSIFNSKPCSYPPPREKCAGPLCTNAYRYRDSKLNLPVCSLKCYRAVHGSA